MAWFLQIHGSLRLLVHTQTGNKPNQSHTCFKLKLAAPRLLTSPASTSCSRACLQEHRHAPCLRTIYALVWTLHRRVDLDCSECRWMAVGSHAPCAFEVVYEPENRISMRKERGEENVCAHLTGCPPLPRLESYPADWQRLAN